MVSWLTSVILISLAAWKIPKSFIQEQGDNIYYDNDGDGDNDDNDDDDEDEDEEEDTTVVSKSSKNLSELNLGASGTSYIPSSFHHHNEEDSVSFCEVAFHIFRPTLTKM